MIDQDHYHQLADWAESPDRDFDPDRAVTGAAAAKAGQDLLRKVGGRPSIDPNAPAGGHSPRRQVRLPRDISDRLDQLAANQKRSPSDVMREAISTYVTSHPS